MGNDVKVGLNNNQGERKKLQRKILLDKNYLRYSCWKKKILALEHICMHCVQTVKILFLVKLISLYLTTPENNNSSHKLQYLSLPCAMLFT